MALASSGIFIEVQTGGNDSYGGGFVPTNTSMATDLAATSATGNAPVVTSASYTFIARDVGHWLFVKSGTNWKPGWYKISSVSAGAATVNATANQWDDISFTGVPILGTTAGCASTTSPTAGTWSVDYSRSTPITFTDLALTSGSATVLTSSANAFGKNFVGNVVSVTGGTGFNVALYEINSVTGTAATTTSGSVGTIGSTGGTGYLGGPLLTPGKAASVVIAQGSVFVASGTYSITTASTNVAGGCLSLTANNAVDKPGYWMGYQTYRGDYAAQPNLQLAAAISNATMVSASGNYTVFDNFCLDLNSNTNGRGFIGQSFCGSVYRVKVLTPKNYGIYINAGYGYLVDRCQVSGATLSFAIRIDGASNNITNCEVYGGSITGFYLAGTGNTIRHSIAYGISGDDGFYLSNTGNQASNCTAYGCRNGFYIYGPGNWGACYNCYAEGNTAYGFNLSAANALSKIVRCGGYNNTSGNYNSNFCGNTVEGFVSVSGGSAFTNAASNDFSLNSTASRGAALRAAGYPGLMPRGTSTGYIDVGAIQHADPAGGGGTAGARLVGPSALVTPGGLL